MKVGNKHQAVVLGVIALLIVGTAIFEVIPKGPRPQPAEVIRAQGQVAASVEQTTNEQLPTTLTSAPFELRSVSTEPASPRPPLVKPNVSLHGYVPLPVGGALPVEPGIHPNLKTAISGPTGTGENTSPNQQQKVVVQNSITLNGIMMVRERSAVFTLAGSSKGSIECGLGGKVDGYKIVSLDDSEVTLQKSGTTLRMAVGDTKSL